MSKPKKLTVMELKELEPKLEVYELNKYSKYIVMIEKSSLLTPEQANYVANTKAREIMKVLAAHQIPCAILIGVGSDVRFIELEKTNGQ